MGDPESEQVTTEYDRFVCAVQIPRAVVERPEMTTRKRKKLKVKRSEAPMLRSPHFPSNTDASDDESSSTDSVETCTRISITTMATRQAAQMSVTFVVPPQVASPMHEAPSQSCEYENMHRETDSDAPTREQCGCLFNEEVVTSIDTLSEFLRLSQLHLPNRLHLVIKLCKLEFF